MSDKNPTQNIDELLAAREQKIHQVENELAKAPIVELTGVVDATGAGGSRFQGEKQWTLRFELAAWRIDGGPVNEQPITVRRHVSRDELRELQSKIESDTIVRMRARVVEENVLEEPQAYLDEFSGSVDDAELQTLLERLQAPITRVDKQFGTLTFDRQFDWYTATAAWAGEEIELTLSVEEPDELEPCLSIARKLWSEEQDWKRRIDDFAVEELLELKNDAWLSDGEEEVTAEAFKRRMKLQSISIYADGEFEFWHTDGDLFWGHSIQVSGNIEDGPDSADIPG